MSFKQAVKSLLPTTMVEAITGWRVNSHLAEYRNLSTEQIFVRVYEKGHWGKSEDPSQPFFSGSGSRDETIVAPYVASVRQFLSEFSAKPAVVDLGCGDFLVGSQIRPFCGSYIACDIVPSLIEFNRGKFKADNVVFRVLDVSEDDLPQADVVFVRQVLQHLSNAHIAKVTPKLERCYKFLVITEHVPQHDFKANLDKPAGPDTRLRIGSGLILTDHPFNLKVVGERVLCEIPEFEGLVRTTAYTLA